MSDQPVTRRPARAGLHHFADDELEAIQAAVLAVVAANPGRWGRTRLSGIVAHLIDCADEHAASVPLPLSLPADMPSMRAITTLLDAMLDEHLLIATPSSRPVLAITWSGYRLLDEAGWVGPRG